jgi:hypothetical protein
MFFAHPALSPGQRLSPRTTPQLAAFSPLPRLWFASRARLAAPTHAPATFTGGRFLPVSERNQKLVNSIARVVQPQAGRSETGRCVGSQNPPTPALRRRLRQLAMGITLHRFHRLASHPGR